MAEDTVRYMFILIFLFIVVAYFVGAATDVNVLASNINKIILSLQGRNAQGQITNYPTGGGKVQGG